jgi:hypothetical protein
LLEGIADGTIEILGSDHAPHATFEKEVEFDAAPFGIVGLETEVGLFIDILVHKTKTTTLARLIEMFTTSPARLLKINAGTLSAGVAADVTLIDPDLEWTVDAKVIRDRFVQYAVRRLEAEGSCGADDGGRPVRLEAVARRSRAVSSCSRRRYNARVDQASRFAPR